MSELKDVGPNPFTLDIEEATKENNNFRTTLWTGDLMQLTVMSIPVGGDVGLEVHGDTDQFLRLEQGKGRVEMGPTETEVTFTQDVEDDWAIIVPKGVWHNIINTGSEPMKLYSLYAPPHHPHGTVHATQADDHADHHDH